MNYTIIAVILIVAGLIAFFVKKIINIFAYALLIIGIGLLIFALRTPSQNPPDQILACSNDAQCVKVTTTCCPCSMGGEEKCVPAKNASLYEPKDCPENVLCIALFNCKIEACSCEEGNCTEVLKEGTSLGEGLS